MGVKACLLLVSVYDYLSGMSEVDYLYSVRSWGGLHRTLDICFVPHPSSYLIILIATLVISHTIGTTVVSTGVLLLLVAYTI